MDNKKKLARVVIVGGGFAGVAAAKELIRQKVAATITLISDKDYLTYYPNLYTLVTTATQTDVVIPLVKMLPKDKVHIVCGKVTSYDEKEMRVMYEDMHGATSVAYDYLVLALGSEANYFSIPGLEARSFSFKSVDEALRLKGHFERLFANAKKLSKDELVMTLHFLVVGGGPSGVELAATLKPYLVTRAKAHGVDPRLITVDIIEGAPRLLPALSERAARQVEKRLRSLGVNIFTNRTLQSEGEDEVVLNTMEIKTDTVIWTAGTAINHMYPVLPGVALSDKKRVVVNEYLQLPHSEHVFIAGDGAATLYSGLAQTAMHNGNYIGKAIARALDGKTLIPYVPKEPTFVIPVGSRWAVFAKNNFLLSGWIPSSIRHVIDWYYRVKNTIE